MLRVKVLISAIIDYTDTWRRELTVTPTNRGKRIRNYIHLRPLSLRGF